MRMFTMFSKSIYITIDMGDTNGRVTAFRNLRDIRPLGAENFKVTPKIDRDTTDAFADDWTNLVHAIRQLQSRFGKVAGIAFAIAGEVDGSGNSIVRTGNLTHWVGKPIRQRLMDTFGCRVIIRNDAVAAALADAVYGHVARDNELQNIDFVGLIWGSGVGGACIRFVGSWRTSLLRSVPVLGSLPVISNRLSRPQYETIPGEWGHLRTGDDVVMAQPCGCGKRDCVESHCGGNKLPQWYKRYGSLITDAADLTDDEWMDDILPYFINGLEDYLNAQPVKLVIMSGGIACKRSWVFDEIQEELRQRGFNVAVLLSYFGESAGAIGALSLFALND